MVETAIALPIIVMVIVWIFYLGIFLNAQIAVNSAARAGARHFGITQNLEETQARVSETMAGGGLTGHYTVEAIVQGGYVNVWVRYHMESFIERMRRHTRRSPGRPGIQRVSPTHGRRWDAPRRPAVETQGALVRITGHATHRLEDPED